MQKRFDILNVESLKNSRNRGGIVVSLFFSLWREKDFIQDKNEMPNQK